MKILSNFVLLAALVAPVGAHAIAKPVMPVGVPLLQMSLEDNNLVIRGGEPNGLVALSLGTTIQPFTLPGNCQILSPPLWFGIVGTFNEGGEFTLDLPNVDSDPISYFCQAVTTINGSGHFMASNGLNMTYNGKNAGYSALSM